MSTPCRGIARASREAVSCVPCVGLRRAGVGSSSLSSMTTARFRFTRPGGASSGPLSSGASFGASFSSVRSTTCESSTSTGASVSGEDGFPGATGATGIGGRFVRRDSSVVPVPAADCPPDASRPQAATRSSARLFPGQLPGVGLFGIFQRSTTRRRASSRCATPPPSTATFSGPRRSAPFASTRARVSASLVPAGMATASASIGRYSYATTRFGPSVSASFSTRFSHAGWSLYRSLKLAETFATSSHCTTRRPPRIPGSRAGSPSACPGARHPEPALFMSACRNCK